MPMNKLAPQKRTQALQMMAEGISNPFIDDIYERAKKAGATGGKISGAGGGGFMTFYCPAISKYKVMEVLAGLGTSILTTSRGVMTGREAVKVGVGGEVLCNIW